MLDDSFEYDGGIPCSQPANEDTDGFRIVWGASTTSVLRELAVPKPSKPARTSPSVEALLNGTASWKSGSAVGSVKRSSGHAGLASPTRLGGSSYGFGTTGHSSHNGRSAYSSAVGGMSSSVAAARLSKRRRRFPTASLHGETSEQSGTDTELAAMYNELQRRLDAREQLDAATADAADDKENADPKTTSSVIPSVHTPHTDKATLADDTLRMSQGMAAIRLDAAQDRPALAHKSHNANSSRVHESPRKLELPLSATDTSACSRGEDTQLQKRRTLDRPVPVLVKDDLPPARKSSQPPVVLRSVRSTQMVADSYPQSSKSASTLALQQAVEAAAMPIQNRDDDNDDDDLYWNDTSMELAFEIAMSQLPVGKQGTVNSSNAAVMGAPPLSKGNERGQMNVAEAVSAEADESVRIWNGFERRDRRTSHQPRSSPQEQVEHSSQTTNNSLKLSSKPLPQLSPPEAKRGPKKQISPRSVSLNTINAPSARNMPARQVPTTVRAHSTQAITKPVLSTYNIATRPRTDNNSIVVPTTKTSALQTVAPSRTTSYAKPSVPASQSAGTHKAFKPPSIVRPDKANAARAKVVQTKAAVKTKSFTPQQVDLATLGLDETFEFDDNDFSF